MASDPLEVLNLTSSARAGLLVLLRDDTRVPPDARALEPVLGLAAVRRRVNPARAHVHLPVRFLSRLFLPHRSSPDASGPYRVFAVSVYRRYPEWVRTILWSCLGISCGSMLLSSWATQVRCAGSRAHAQTNDEAIRHHCSCGSSSFSRACCAASPTRSSVRPRSRLTVGRSPLTHRHTCRLARLRVLDRLVDSATRDGAWHRLRWCAHFLLAASI